jgi:hypothetical protein
MSVERRGICVYVVQNEGGRIVLDSQNVKAVAASLIAYRSKTVCRDRVKEMTDGFGLYLKPHYDCEHWSTSI